MDTGVKMLHVAICDDEKAFVRHLTGLLNQYSEETGRDIRITAFYDGMELIEKYDTTIDLIFLDIQMRLVNGLRAAERIRRMDKNVGIIFLTTLAQYGLEGYKYRASLSGLIVIPTLAIIAPVLIVCGIVSPILMAVKMVDYIFNLSLPYVENMGVFTGIVELNPIAEFVCSVVIGVLLYLAGRGCWKLLVYYIKGVSKAKRHLSI